MKTTKPKTHRITFQEKTPKGFVDKSFDTYKDHVEFKVGSNAKGSSAGRRPSGRVDASHLSQMKKSPDLIRQVSFKSI